MCRLEQGTAWNGCLTPLIMLGRRLVEESELSELSGLVVSLVSLVVDHVCMGLFQVLIPSWNRHHSVMTRCRCSKRVRWCVAALRPMFQGVKQLGSMICIRLSVQCFSQSMQVNLLCYE